MELIFGVNRITMIQLVRRYPLDAEVRTKAYEFEKRLNNVFRNGVVVNQVPQNAPPEIPYFVFQDNRKQLIVSKNSVQLTLDFSRGFPADETVYTIAKKYAEIMDSMLDDLLGYQQSSYSGLVVYYARPFSGERERLMSALYKQIIGREEANIAGFSCLVGRQIGNMLCNVEVGEYFSLNTLQTVTNEPVYVDPDFVTPDEKGLQIKLDVNTKRLKDAPIPDSFSQMCGYLEAVHRDAHELLGSLMAQV